MKKYILFILLMISCAFIGNHCFGQDFLSDIKQVSKVYGSNENFVIEWVNYLVDSPESETSYVYKKCDDNYYLEGDNQINCINGRRQVFINKNEKTAVYSGDYPQSFTTDPITLITALFENGYTAKLIQNTAGLRQYLCRPVTDGGHILDIWIDIKNWRVLKVIEHAEAGLGHGFVFELKKYLPYCDAGPEMNIQSYLHVDNHSKPSLNARYASYELLSINSIPGN